MKRGTPDTFDPPRIIEQAPAFNNVIRTRGPLAAAAIMGALARGRPNEDMQAPPNIVRERPERMSDGNPNRLTVEQHIFPTRSIERFLDKSGRVDLQDDLHQKRRPAKPRDSIFCARRAWDQRAEAGYMKSIEDQFQHLATQIVASHIQSIPADQKEIVDQFYALWYMRGRHKRLSSQQIQLNGVYGDMLSLEEEENLEKKHYLWVRPDGNMPARQFNGLWLQQQIDGYAAQLSSRVNWRIVQALAGEFLVPDVPEALFVPLSPTIGLASADGDGKIIEDDVARINRFMMDHSREYYFARDLKACPALPPT